MKVHVGTVHQIVRMLARQCPTRYYLDAKGDCSYSHVAIEVYLHPGEPCPDRLHEEMKASGLSFTGARNTHDFWIGRWEGERLITWEEEIG